MTYTEYVTRVIDGNTFETRNGLVIRIASIDVPKGNNLGCVAATNYLSHLIEDKTIILESHGTSYHGKTIATVWRQSDRLNIGDAMVRGMYADQT